ncbi:MAG TPA: UDP-glucose/GDP-mannose dehydrogenase family protein [Candidatus Saccharimonadales bacterium]|jgi:UDPglucose 6-dehydrogenase|nr:UDP-glucose/GDP-mannose dehydrogenase family protein [Candidatus Saccharimonadales bacterium]
MKIAVVGTGYVGLVSGTCFADCGNQVTCIDIDADKVAQMQRGEVPIYEPGLADIFARTIADGRLNFTTDLKAGIAGAQVIFLALPTPSDADGSADLSAVLRVADQLGELLTNYAVIVDKSTVPVGTADTVRVRIAVSAKNEFDVVSNPEFLREGFAIADFMEPDRVVIGTESDRARDVMQELYRPFVSDARPLIVMDERSAEMAKYAANSFLITKISFINEIANVCERVGADVDMVRRAIGADQRIGHRFLQAGIGYGGSCFPKDVKALIKTASDHDYEFKLLRAAMAVNAEQQRLLVQKVIKQYGLDLSDKTFAVWGLAFKPDTDDTRESPALVIIDELMTAGAHIKAFDPEAADHIRALYKDQTQLEVIGDKYDALQAADALLIATEWAEFSEPDFNQVKQLLKTPLIFDGRNMYQPRHMQELGFTYISIGRSTQ